MAYGENTPGMSQLNDEEYEEDGEEGMNDEEEQYGDEEEDKMDRRL